MEYYNQVLALKRNPPTSLEEVKLRIPALAENVQSLEELFFRLCTMNTFNELQYVRPLYDETAREMAADIARRSVSDPFVPFISIEVFRVLFTSYGLRHEDVRLDDHICKNLLGYAISTDQSELIKLLKTSAQLQVLTQEEKENAIRLVVKSRNSHVIATLCQNWDFSGKELQEYALELLAKDESDADFTFLLQTLSEKLGITRESIKPEILHLSAAEGNLYILRYLKKTFGIGVQEFGQGGEEVIGAIFRGNTTPHIRYVAENFFPREWIESASFINYCLGRDNTELLEMLKPVFNITDEIVRTPREDSPLPISIAFQNFQCTEIAAKFLKEFNYTMEDFSDKDILKVIYNSVKNQGNYESLQILTDHLPEVRERILTAPMPLENIDYPEGNTRVVTKLVEVLFSTGEMTPVLLQEMIRVLDLRVEHLPKKGFVAASYLITDDNNNTQNLSILQEQMGFRFADLKEEEKKEFLKVIIGGVKKDVTILRMLQSSGFVPSQLTDNTKAELWEAIKESNAVNVALFFNQHGVDFEDFEVF